MFQNLIKSLVLELIWNKSKETKKPIYFIVDDTSSEKTKSLSKHLNPIEKCGFHNSHSKGKTVYGLQILVPLLSCDGLVVSVKVCHEELANANSVFHRN